MLCAFTLWLSSQLIKNWTKSYVCPDVLNETIKAEMEVHPSSTPPQEDYSQYSYHPSKLPMSEIKLDQIESRKWGVLLKHLPVKG